MPFIYLIKCKIEPYKEYIGQTAQEDFQVRLNGHVSEVCRGTRRHLYNAIRRYGWEHFTVQVLHSFPKEGNWEERLDKLEIQEIARRGTLAPNGYNYETGGNKCKTLHEDTKELMSSVRSGARHAMFGKHHSDEVRELLKEANRKAVEQWSRERSELLRTFESVEEASRATGAGGSHITKVCKGERKTAGGFHWKFVNDSHKETKNILKFTKVQQWSFDCKTLIAEYDTIREASNNTGVDNSHIGRCCKRKGRSAGGFKWKAV